MYLNNTMSVTETAKLSLTLTWDVFKSWGEVELKMPKKFNFNMRCI